MLVGVLATIAVGAGAFVLPDWSTELLPALAVLPLPTACLVALVRHRLWDVDLVLSRSLVPQDPSAAVALLDRLVPRLNEAVRDVRSIVHDLRPPTLDELGLAGSVRELATRLATPTRSVSVDAEDLAVLPAAVDVAAYRIVSESLANAAKHSSASSVRLALRCTTSSLQVEVSDDGVGLAPGAVPGVGLRSMRERAEELGGSCTVTSGQAGGGTTVAASLPLQRERA